MLHFTKSGIIHKLFGGLVVMSICSFLSSCSNGLVQDDIIIEDCIKIPKQDGAIVIHTDEDNDNDLVLKLKVENIKNLEESDIEPNFKIMIGLYDKDDVELIYVRDDLDRDFFTQSKGYKTMGEFSLTWANIDKSKEELEEIKKNTVKIKVKESKIKKTKDKKE